MEEKNLIVILKDGTDISEKVIDNGQFVLFPYDETIESPNDYFYGISINGTKYENVVVIKVLLEKEGYYFAIDFLGE